MGGFLARECKPFLKMYDVKLSHDIAENISRGIELFEGD